MLFIFTFFNPYVLEDFSLCKLLIFQLMSSIRLCEWINFPFLSTNFVHLSSPNSICISSLKVLFASVLEFFLCFTHIIISSSIIRRLGVILQYGNFPFLLHFIFYILFPVVFFFFLISSWCLRCVLCLQYLYFVTTPLICVNCLPPPPSVNFVYCVWFMMCL